MERIVAGRIESGGKALILFCIGTGGGVPDAGGAIRELRASFIVLLAVPVAILGQLAHRACADCRMMFTARLVW